MVLLSRGWSGCLNARVAEARALSQLLGDDHDLALLVDFVRSQSADALRDEQVAAHRKAGAAAPGGAARASPTRAVSALYSEGAKSTAPADCVPIGRRPSCSRITCPRRSLPRRRPRRRERRPRHAGVSAAVQTILRLRAISSRLCKGTYTAHIRFVTLCRRLARRRPEEHRERDQNERPVRGRPRGMARRTPARGARAHRRPVAQPGHAGRNRLLADAPLSEGVSVGPARHRGAALEVVADPQPHHPDGASRAQRQGLRHDLEQRARTRAR